MNKIKRHASWIARGAFVGLAVVTFMVVTQTPSQPSPPRIVIHGAQVTALTNAADYASWCGGAVEIDSNPRDIVVVDCDE